MGSALTRKLSSYVSLAEDDLKTLDGLTKYPNQFKAGQHLFRQGDRVEGLSVLISGWAYRYKTTATGRRQIMALLMPGDLCDPYAFLLSKMDHSVAFLSDARCALIPKHDVLAMSGARPRIAQAMWWSTLVDEAILRHWLVNLGCRDAQSRIANLICELYTRASVIGDVLAGAFDLPLTQEQFADVLGITSVHMNRVLQRMRREGLISFEHKRLTVHDLPALQRVAEFDPAYMHYQYTS